MLPRVLAYIWGQLVSKLPGQGSTYREPPHRSPHCCVTDFWIRHTESPQKVNPKQTQVATASKSNLGLLQECGEGRLTGAGVTQRSLCHQHTKAATLEFSAQLAGAPQSQQISYQKCGFPPCQFSKLAQPWGGFLGNLGSLCFHTFSEGEVWLLPLPQGALAPP